MSDGPCKLCRRPKSQHHPFKKLCPLTDGVERVSNRERFNNVDVYQPEEAPAAKSTELHLVSSLGLRACLEDISGRSIPQGTVVHVYNCRYDQYFAWKVGAVAEDWALAYGLNLAGRYIMDYDLQWKYEWIKHNEPLLNVRPYDNPWKL